MLSILQGCYRDGIRLANSPHACVVLHREDVALPSLREIEELSVIEEGMKAITESHLTGELRHTGQGGAAGQA